LNDEEGDGEIDVFVEMRHEWVKGWRAWEDLKVPAGLEFIRELGPKRCGSRAYWSQITQRAP
jgi:hypothetical protein